MASYFKPTISNFYHKFLRLLTMSSNEKTAWFGIPSSPTPVFDYCDRLQAQYMLEGIKRMESFLVLELKLYKTRETSRHEYVSAKLLAPNGKTFYLAIERGLGEIEDRVDPQAQTGLPGGLTPLPPSAPASASHSQCPSETHLPSEPSQTDVPATDTEKVSYLRQLTSASASASASISSLSLTSSSSAASLDSLFSKRVADDKVSPLGSSGKKNECDEVFCTLSFCDPSTPSSTPLADSKPMCLYELAVMAQTLHSTTRSYLLFSNNCYYYAGMVVKVIQEVYHPTVAVATTGSADTDRKLGLLHPKKEKECKAGAWYGIQVYSGEKIDTTPLKEKFTRDLEMFRAPVQEYEDSRNMKEAEISRLTNIIQEMQKQGTVPVPEQVS